MSYESKVLPRRIVAAVLWSVNAVVWLLRTVMPHDLRTVV
jgi:hypothetical protein